MSDDDAATGPARATLELAEALMAQLGRSAATEIEVEQGDLRIRLVRGAGAAASGVAVAAVPEAGREEVRMPMTGVLYRGRDPGAPPLVSVGDTVAAGDELAIIEAMKVFTKLTAPVAGKVVAIPARDGDTLNAGEVVMEISPAGAAAP